jgi:hypothetical protein
MYFDNKGSLILAVNIETVWIFTLASSGYKVNFNFVTCRIKQRFAEFSILTEFILASHLSTREIVPG